MFEKFELQQRSDKQWKSENYVGVSYSLSANQTKTRHRSIAPAHDIWILEPKMFRGRNHELIRRIGDLMIERLMLAICAITIVAMTLIPSGMVAENTRFRGVSGQTSRRRICLLFASNSTRRSSMLGVRALFSKMSRMPNNTSSLMQISKAVSNACTGYSLRVTCQTTLTLMTTKAPSGSI